MKIETVLSRKLGIDYPIIQAGMSWASSNAALPVAVSNAGGLGMVAAGPMRPNDLRNTLAEVKASTDRAWAVNVPLYRKGVEEILDIIAEARPPVIVASQGAPGENLKRFHDLGSMWLHVAAFPKHAEKAAMQGVDGLVVVGVEAGGHPPDDGASALVAIRRILQVVDCPVVASGAAADGYGIAGLLAAGADAVQLGTRFLMTTEANVHDAYKQAVLKADVGDTVLAGRGNLPVRALRNEFTDAVLAAEASALRARDLDAWKELLASATLKQAAFDGDVARGKVEAGQTAGLISDILPAAEVMARLVAELKEAFGRIEAMSGRVSSRSEIA